MISNKKPNPIVTELFIRIRKISILIVFIMQSYFRVPKDVTQNSAHYFTMTFPNKREFQQLETNHLSDIDLKDFTKMNKRSTA